LPLFPLGDVFSRPADPLESEALLNSPEEFLVHSFQQRSQ
jgi:hypothetical protein